MKLCIISLKYPGRFSGAATRNYHFIRTLLDSGWHIRLITISPGRYEYELREKYGEEVLSIYYLTVNGLSGFARLKTLLSGQLPFLECLRQNHVINQYVNLINDCDLVHLAELEAYALLEPVISQIKRPLILDAHNVQSQSFRDELRSRSLLIDFVSIPFRRFLTGYETRAVKNTDHLLVCSPYDLRYFTRYKNPDDITLIHNAVDLKRKRNIRLGQTILFMGNLGYPPNSFGVKHYLIHIHPLVIRSCPSAELVITGRNMPVELRDLINRSPHARYAGFVPDPSDYIQNARVGICPIYHGSGTRLKILEYLAGWCPVVSTAKGAEGLALANGKDLLAQDTDTGFSEAVVRILTDQVFAQRLAGSGFNKVKKYYDRKKVYREVDKLYRRLAD
jgi:glycosyltransferase involved in cell wall biosynthesis